MGSCSAALPDLIIAGATRAAAPELMNLRRVIIAKSFLVKTTQAPDYGR
jgi:hypothetical protein